MMLLGLSACATEVMIGDQSVPVMGPGEGLIASSVVFQNPNSAANLKAGHKSSAFTFTYEALDGDNKEVVLPLKENTAAIDSQSVRSVDDDGNPILMLTRAKPGKYRLRQAWINPYPYKGVFALPVVDAPIIEVVAGQVTYAGSQRLFSRTRWVGGDLRVSDMWFKMENDFEIDINDIKKVEPRLRTVVIKNGLAR